MDFESGASAISPLRREFEFPNVFRVFARVYWGLCVLLSGGCVFVGCLQLTGMVKQ